MNVANPMLTPNIKPRPSAKIVHGSNPAPAAMITATPNPNIIFPTNTKNKVSIRGLIFRGYSELHLVLGTSLIEKNFMSDM